MRHGSLLRRGRALYAEQGPIRTIGAVIRFVGNEIVERRVRLDEIREEDAGRGYPLGLRLRAARHGVSAHTYLWLGLDAADVDRYLTSSAPFREVNDGHVRPIHDKYTFQLLTEPYVGSLPTLYGVIDQGTFTAPVDPHRDDDVLAVLERAGALVLKPTTGLKGTGIYVLESGDEGILVNGQSRERAAVAELLGGLDEYLVTAFVRQHAYAASIFPAATNTLRVFSILDPDTGDAHVLRATHRFGSAASAPTDNWSRGGYCAPVDVETGVIGRLLRIEGTQRVSLDHHPETGAPVEGVTVPAWDAVRDLVGDVATLHRQAPFVGWDVVVSADGPVLLEGNARPGIRLLQLERGALEDERLRRLLGAR